MVKVGVGVAIWVGGRGRGMGTHIHTYAHTCTHIHTHMHIRAANYQVTSPTLCSDHAQRLATCVFDRCGCTHTHTFEFLIVFGG